MSTLISPSLTARLAPAQPRTAPVFSRISERDAPLSSSLQAFGLALAEDDIDILEFDGGGHALSFRRRGRRGRV